VPLPSRPEQIEIVSDVLGKARTIDDLASATERTIALLKERRSALIAAAVTGQIPIPPESIP
jgi:type I restriction enzyme, S subunit